MERFAVVVHRIKLVRVNPKTQTQTPYSYRKNTTTKAQTLNTQTPFASSREIVATGLAREGFNWVLVTGFSLSCHNTEIPLVAIDPIIVAEPKSLSKNPVKLGVEVLG